MTILILDDSPIMITSLTRMLKRAGYEVEAATDGAQGLARLQAGLKPKLIITDLNMPNMDGISFIRAARKVAAVRFTPILVLTTESTAAANAEARAAGATGWLTKPTEPNELLGIVGRYAPAA